MTPDVNIQLQVGGQTIPVFQFECTGSAYGSVGSATATTSLAALAGQQIDLYAITTQGAGVTPVTIDVALGSGQRTRIFGGEYLTTTWSMDEDQVSIHARSWAGVLADQKRILTKIGAAVQKTLAPLAPGQIKASGISNQNQTVGMIVTAIANEFGFTPVLNLSGSNNPTIGTLYGSADQTFMPVPQSLWSILNQLARDTGYVVYDTPNKQLVFGAPGAGLPTLTFSYNVPPPSQDVQPARRLVLTHHPRRNSTFRVLVISYDPAKAQVGIGRAAYVGANYAGSNGLNAGLSTGSSAVSTDAKLAKLDQGSNQIPLYTFHMDGLTQAQADTQAASIASDIAKRELLISFEADGLPGIAQTQMLKLTGNVPSPFTQPTFYASGFSHSFVQPGRKTKDNRAGFLTRIKGLNIPTEALAAETAG